MAGLLAVALSGQTNPICGDTDTGPSCNLFDTTGSARLIGSTYFVRELELAGVNSTGTSLSTAYSLMGTMTFASSVDSSGNTIYTYAFTGQELVSPATEPVAFTASGGYAVSANGMLVIQDLAFSASACLGAVGAAGPNAFVASHPGATSNNVVIMVGIPVGGTALSGAYYGSYFDLNKADVTTIREASFPFTADGNGNLGTLTVRGIGTDLGNTVQTQSVPAVTYSFAGNVGTMNFGTSQYISGSQTFYVSADGSLILGGTPGDYDLLIGIKALAGTASNAALSGVYVLGGFENDSSVPGENIFHAFNGSTSATGSGTSITHRQLVSSDTTHSPYFRDYTTTSTYTIPDSGVFTPGDNYQYALGANGTFLATGQAGLESVMLGLKAPAFSGTGVWLNPIGIVNAANSAPFTNPVAPNELVTLYGEGMAPDGVVFAPSLPLPTILNGVQVYVNGSPAPLFAVSPTLIQVLSPSKWYPAAGWGYVTFQIFNNGNYSNAVRLLAQNSAPGVFNLTGSATGPGAVRHALDNTLVDSSHPAHPDEIVAIYATGLGLTANQPADGSAGLYSWLTHAWRVYIGGVQCDPLKDSNYAGLAPGFAGLYQINVTVPSGTGFGDVPLEIWLTEGQTVETTINIQP